jgi:hypothetical protein
MSAGFILVILILIPLHHEVGYLELLIPQWYMSFEKYFSTSTSLVPHFRTDLYTRTRLVYQKADPKPNTGRYITQIGR